MKSHRRIAAVFLLGGMLAHVFAVPVSALPVKPTTETLPVGEAAPDGASEPQTTSAAPDTTAAFPEKKPSHTAWEKVLAFPGMVVYAPFWILFQVAGGAIIINEEYAVIPKAIDLLTTADGRRGLAPMYSARHGVGISYFVKDYFNEDSRFNLTTSWGFRGRQFYQVRFRRLDILGGALTAGVRVQYSKLPDDRFYGIGIDSKESNETNYLHQQPLAEITLGKRFTRKLQTDLILGFEHNIIGEGRRTNSPSTTEIFDETTLPGLQEEMTMSRAGVSILWDRRNRAFRPSKGFHFIGAGGIIQETNDKDFGYTVAAADVEGYFDLFYNRILVVRAAATFTDPMPNRQIPFYKLSTLGHVETIRGFQRGRFRDRDMVLASAEYRYPVWRYLDGLFFVDGGQVSPDLIDRFSIGDWRWTFGGGFRVWGVEGTIMRLEIGFSDDGYRFHFIFNE